jgi:hypothetical protein
LANVWKHKLLKCKAHGGLRVIGNRLFASSGGYITKEAITNVITRPANAFTIDKDNIKFHTSCEIVGIDLAESYNQPTEVKPPSEPLFVSREQPNPAISTLTSKSNMDNSVMNDQNTDNQPYKFDYTIYNSDLSNGFKSYNLGSKNKLIKTITSNGKDYLTLKRLGILSIPMLMISPNRDYTVVLTMKLLSGNGKISIAMSNSNTNPSYVSLLADRTFRDSRINIKTGTQMYPGDFFKINIAMLEDSIGEILISRLMIIENNISTQYINTNKIPITPFYLQQANKSPINIQLTSNANINISGLNSDLVKENTKRAAIIYADRPAADLSFDIDAAVEPLTYSSRQWVGKINSIVKGLKIVDKTNQLENVDKINTTPLLVIGSLGNLKVCPRVFIEEWNIRETPSENDKQVLSQCETIITPSFVNLHILKQIFPVKNIISLPRFWPAYLVSPNMSEKYYLYFEKFSKITDMLIGSWKDIYSKLYIIGSTVDIMNKSNIQHISEYLPYSELLSYIFGATAIINLSYNNNYMSGIDNLAIHSKLNLITNNLAYFINEYPNVKFVNSQMQSSDLLIIDPATLQGAVEQMAITISNGIIPSEYGTMFKDNILDLLGKK